MLENRLKYLPFMLVAIANSYGMTFSNETMLGEPRYSFDFCFRALALQPSTNNLYYAAEAFPFNNSIATPIVSPRWAIFDLHPKFHFGFDIGGRMTFHSRDSNLSLNWQHFKSHTRASVSAPSSQDMVGPFSSIGPDAGPYSRAAGSVAFHFDEVNLRYGQYLDLASCIETNLFAGISFAHIKQCLNAFYAGDNGISRRITTPSSFKGAGPQVGIDIMYDIICGLSLTGQFAAALLVGTAKNHTTYASASPLLTTLGDPSPNIQSTSVQNRIQMIPSFTERLGLAYSFNIWRDFYGTLEVGYEAKIFINAIQSTDLSSGVINVAPFDNTVGVFARTFSRTLGNFALGGPYVAFNLAF